MGPQWHFPADPEGEYRGFNDPGVVQFPKLRTLVREVIQNSVDAAAATGHPVRVTLSLKEIAVADVGGRELRQHLRECMEWEGNREAPVARTFFEQAVRMLDGDSIPALVISDFGTTGLRGSTGKDPNSEWGQLLLGVGLSRKADGAGGTFGVGKYAPFGLSALRTVMYGTRDLDGHYAFAGLSRLTTHERQGQQLKDVGWYGHAQRRPATTGGELASSFARSEPGTDLFILGFDPGGKWQSEVIAAVLDNFLVTLHEGTLAVAVSDEVVSKDTLAECVGQHADPATQGFFLALRQPDLHCAVPFSYAGGAAELEVWLARTPDGHGRYIYEARQTGMRISLHAHRSPLACAGVVVARGADLNRRLRALEPPTHDKWDLERSNCRSADSRILRAMRAWVSEQVQHLSEAPIESGDAAGVADYLPDSDDGPAKRAPGKSETAGEAIPVMRVPPGGARPKMGVATGAPKKSPAHPAPGEPRPEGQASGQHSRGGAGGEGLGRRIVLGSARVWCRNGEDLYRVQIQVPAYQQVVLQIAAAGESGEENLRVASATDASGSGLPVAANGCIGPVALGSGGTAVLDVHLADRLRSAIRVTAREAG